MSKLLIMKTKVQYLFLALFLASCNISNSLDYGIETNLKLESKKISNLSDIEATFTIRNGTDETKGYGFASACQFGFEILREGVEVFDLAKNSVCATVLTSFTLESNESISFTLPKYFDRTLEPGSYIIKSYLIGYENEVNATNGFVVSD